MFKITGKRPPVLGRKMSAWSRAPSRTGISMSFSIAISYLRSETLYMFLYEGRGTRPSFGLDVVLDDDLAPVLDLLQHELMELGRRAVHDDRHEHLLQRALHRGTFHDFHDIRMDAIEQRLRDAGGGEQAVPGVGSDGGEARLCGRGHVRQFRGPFQA